jgi:hypothetical protein
MNTTEQKVTVINRISNKDAKTLAEMIGVTTGELLLCLNGLFEQGVFLCQLVQEEKNPSEPIEAPPWPSEALQADIAYYESAEDLKRAAGPQIGQCVPYVNEYSGE